MLRLVAIGVCAFALGVLLRDAAQDYAKPDPVCERAKENAARYATALVHLLNQKPVELQGATISCRVKHSEEKS